MTTISTSHDLVISGEVVTLTAAPQVAGQYWYEWSLVTKGSTLTLLDAPDDQNNAEVHWDTTGLTKGAYKVRVELYERVPDPSAPKKFSRGGATDTPAETSVIVAESTKEHILSRAIDEVRLLGDRLPRTGGVTRVTLDTASGDPTTDQGLWAAIRNRTAAIDFNRYSERIDAILCAGGDKVIPQLAASLENPSAILRGLGGAGATLHGAYAYNVLKLATEIFLILEAGVVAMKSGSNTVTLLDPSLFNATEETERFGREITLDQLEGQLTSYFNGRRELPYLTQIVRELLPDAQRKEVLPYCFGVLRHRWTCPTLIELIWSYWHEESMLVQTMNAISLRFQNRRSSDRDPLAQLEIDPLRPLNNLLWGYVQDEQHRLTVMRRAYEYDHHYGITLHGKAVAALRAADSRSKFIEAFHNLLHQCAIFYQQEADTTVVADGFPLLNALKELHLILAEGAHNQFGDLPWTARSEMLIQQWLLARPEMTQFLNGRTMVPYQQPWMGKVDAMKKLQSWTDVTVTHFHDLATFGEQLLLSVRYGAWNVVTNQNQARNWARYWRPELQGYTHAYRAVTGVDLTTDPVDANPPWVHLRARIDEQRRRIARA